MRNHRLPKGPTRRGAAYYPSGLRLAAALVLLAALLGPLLGPQRTARADVSEALTDRATLEARQPEVQWSVAGAVGWLSVADRETVRAGDRVRTGPEARARLVYFEGTVIEVEPSTGLLVERLETSPSGGIVTRLLQTAGVTVSRVVHLVDPAASFEVETPAAVVFVRGTTPRVEVDPEGTSHVRNVPDGTASRVGVRGKDPAQTEVILLPGQETDVAPGQAPAPPRASAPTATPTPTGWTITLAAFPTAMPTPGVSSNPCRRLGVVCDPFPTVDPCRVRPSYCGPGGPEPAPPTPTRGLPPPIGDTGSGRPPPTLPQSPIGDVGGSRVFPTLVIPPQQPPSPSPPSGPVPR